MKKLLKIVSLLPVLIFIVWACEDFLSDSNKESNKAERITEAQIWYEANKSEPIYLRSGSDQKVPMKPNWDHSTIKENDRYRTVETALLMKGQVSFLDEECLTFYSETQDERYKQSLTQLVILTDLGSDETIGFLMTITPSLSYLQKTDFKPFRDMSYLERNDHFDGQILYHDLDGNFVNGWKYIEGKITHSISFAENINLSLRSYSCYEADVYVSWEECTYWYQRGELIGGPSNCEIGSERIGTIYFCEDNGGSGGGGGYSTGANLSPCPKEIVKTEAASILQSQNLQPRINAIRANAQNPSASAESAGAFQYMNGAYFPLGPITWGTANSVPIVALEPDVVGAFHSHPGNLYNAHSAGDIGMFSESASYNPNFQFFFAFGSNGSSYALVTDDQSKLRSFFRNHHPSTYVDPLTGDFDKNSQIGKEYKAVYDKLLITYSDETAHTYALGHILVKYDSGIRLVSIDATGNVAGAGIRASGNVVQPYNCK